MVGVHDVAGVLVVMADIQPAVVAEKFIPDEDQAQAKHQGKGEQLGNTNDSAVHTNSIAYPIYASEDIYCLCYYLVRYFNFNFENMGAYYG